MSRLQRGASRWLSLVSLALVFVVGWGLINQQAILDQIKAANFQPSAQLRQLAEATTMKSSARRTFYATQPVISSSTDFKQICHQQHDDGAVLGCYVNDQIYIYDVTNAELSGIEEVTAAHELLHAEYARLPSEKKTKVDQLITDQTNSLRNDPKFSERMKVYNDLDVAGQRDELHSIFGSEYQQLSQELENYYRDYFADRSRVVKLYQGYASVFSKLKTEAEQLSSSLDAQALAINQQKAAYEQNITNYSVAVEQFNQRASSGYYQSQAQFNSDRQNLIGWSNQLEQQRFAINQAVEGYNRDKQRYDGIAAHLSELNNSIDSDGVKVVPKV